MPTRLRLPRHLAQTARRAGRQAWLASLDPARVLAWLFARCVLESPGQPALAEVARAIAP